MIREKLREKAFENDLDAFAPSNAVIRCGRCAFYLRTFTNLVPIDSSIRIVTCFIFLTKTVHITYDDAKIVYGSLTVRCLNS